MSYRTRRRDFLVQSRGVALGFSFLPVATRGQGNRMSAQSEGSASWKTLITDLERQIPKLMEKDRVPGLSIALIRDAKLRWRRGFGVKDGASKRPVDNDTVFEAASMSKPVFAYAVMKLCEKGAMDLDTPLTTYTPERFLEGDPQLELITARHVLSHTSGFQNWRSEKEALKIHFTPGEKYLYSGEGYSYLQSVVTHVTGQLVEPYLLTTPTDYAKFLIEVIDPKASDAFRLSKPGLDEMLRPRVKVNDEYSISWALGWRTAHTKNGDVINHGGDNLGFHSFCEASVQRKSGFVIMTNGDNGGELLKKLAPAVARQIHALSGWQ